jgi:hypothetical protein
MSLLSGALEAVNVLQVEPMRRSLSGGVELTVEVMDGVLARK